MAPKLMKSNLLRCSEPQAFELAPSPMNSNPRFQTVKIDFGCVNDKSKTSNLASKQKWPKYNTDGLFYTPAFVIPEDMAVLSLVQEKLKDEHLKKIATNTQCSTKVYLTSLIIPYSEQKSLCSICKIYYIDMNDHLNSNGHKTNLLKSPYTKRIQQFCLQLFPNAKLHCQQKTNIPFILKDEIKINQMSSMSQRVIIENLSSGQLKHQFSAPQSFQFLSKPKEIQLEISPPIRKRRLC